MLCVVIFCSLESAYVTSNESSLVLNLSNNSDAYLKASVIIEALFLYGHRLWNYATNFTRESLLVRILIADFTFVVLHVRIQVTVVLSHDFGMYNRSFNLLKMFCSIPDDGGMDLSIHCSQVFQSEWF